MKLFEKLIHKLFLLLFFLVGCSSDNSPSENQIDEELLKSAIAKIRNVDGAMSLIVCKDGVNIAEEYFFYNGYGPDDIKNIMSVTKSFTGLLVGIAIEKGYIESINDPISKYLNGLVSFPDNVKSKITIEQLLKMSFGHEWNGTTSSSLYSSWKNSPDQLQYIIDLPLSSTPGTQFNYSDGASHLLSVIIAQAAEQNTFDFAKKYLFDPLGFAGYEWVRDNRGYPNGAADLRIKPRDMVKFGNLLLNKGKYNSVQIVPEDWINSMTSTKISTNNNVPYGPEYGYQIWIGYSSGHKHIMAMGWGGQFIFIVPDKKLVVTATCWHSGLTWQQAGDHWNSIINIIVNEIFPLIK